MTPRALMLSILTVALGLPAPAQAACPTLTRDQILWIAKTGVGCRYVWGGTCWNAAKKTWKGADCSGYVTKVWQIPAASNTATCLPHYYTTSSFKSSSSHWSTISRNSLLKADALNYNTGGSGHIVLYHYGNKWGNAVTYEAMGTKWGIVHGSRYVSSKYAGKRRHRIGTAAPPNPPPPAPPKYPLMTIKTSIATIGAQSRDFCTKYKSKGIFDWKAGQGSFVYVDVKNSGTAVAKNVYIGLWAEQPYLKVTQWNIYTNWKKSGFVLNDTDGMQKIGHTNPAQTFKLWLGAMSAGETKRIRLKVKALKYSIGKADHPDVRAWVWHVDNYYEKSSFWAKPNNVKGYQKQNGGNLHAYTQTDVLSAEVCDKKDNDCDGSVDEGGVCAPPPKPPPKPKPKPKPRPDAGVPKPKADGQVMYRDSGGQTGQLEAGLKVKPRKPARAALPRDNSFRSVGGECNVGGGAGTMPPLLAALFMMLWIRRRM